MYYVRSIFSLFQKKGLGSYADLSFGNRYRKLVLVSHYSEHSYAIILLWQESMEAISQLFFH